MAQNSLTHLLDNSICTVTNTSHDVQSTRTHESKLQTTQRERENTKELKEPAAVEMVFITPKTRPL